MVALICGHYSTTFVDLQFSLYLHGSDLTRGFRTVFQFALPAYKFLCSSVVLIHNSIMPKFHSMLALSSVTCLCKIEPKSYRCECSGVGVSNRLIGGHCAIFSALTSPGRGRCAFALAFSVGRVYNLLL